MTKKEAIKQAVALLKDEANSLGGMSQKDLPHRAVVAIRREIERFREIAETLKPTKVDED